eukprot:2648733-Prymnesium_polylepis.1
MSREPALEVGECPLTRHRPRVRRVTHTQKKVAYKAGFPFRSVLVGPAPPVLDSPHTPSEVATPAAFGARPGGPRAAGRPPGER